MPVICFGGPGGNRTHVRYASEELLPSYLNLRNSGTELLSDSFLNTSKRCTHGTRTHTSGIASRRSTIKLARSSLIDDSQDLPQVGLIVGPTTACLGLVSKVLVEPPIFRPAAPWSTHQAFAQQAHWLVLPRLGDIKTANCQGRTLSLGGGFRPRS